MAEIFIQVTVFSADTETCRSGGGGGLSVSVSVLNKAASEDRYNSESVAARGPALPVPKGITQKRPSMRESLA